jgi:hypothetical protein
LNFDFNPYFDFNTSACSVQRFNFILYLRGYFDSEQKPRRKISFLHDYIIQHYNIQFSTLRHAQYGASISISISIYTYGVILTVNKNPAGKFLFYTTTLYSTTIYNFQHFGVLSAALRFQFHTYGVILTVNRNPAGKFLFYTTTLYSTTIYNFQHFGMLSTALRFQFHFIPTGTSGRRN